MREKINSKNKKSNKNLNKKGVSPVIATVLLIAMVIVIGLLIFLWFRGMMVERLTKFDSAVELVCDDVRFEGSYSVNRVSIVNTGNVPIYDINLEVTVGRSRSVIETIFGKDEHIRPGDSKTTSTDVEGTPTQITAIPVILGLTEDGEARPYPCDKNGILIFSQ